MIVVKHKSGVIFRNIKSVLWSADTINSPLSRLAAKIDEKYSIYDFRHSFAHRMSVSGMDPLAVLELMGHESLVMLKKVYGHLDKGAGYLLEGLRKISTEGAVVKVI